MVGVLVSVQVLDVGVPRLVGDLVPPGSPADEGVEARDKLRSVIDGFEGLLHFGVGADKPRGLGVAAAVGDKEPHGSAPRPILVIPGLGIVSFDAAPESFQPFPEKILGLADLVGLKDLLDDNETIDF